MVGRCQSTEYEPERWGVKNHFRFRTIFLSLRRRQIAIENEIPPHISPRWGDTCVRGRICFYRYFTPTV